MILNMILPRRNKPSPKLKRGSPAPIFLFEQLLVCPFVENRFQLVTSHVEKFHIRAEKLFRIMPVKALYKMDSLRARHSPTPNINTHVLRASAKSKLEIHQVGMKIVKAGIRLSKIIVSANRS